MRYCWQNQLPHIEMLKSQVDNSGYDIVLEAKSIMRHIQLKASHVGSATARVNINRDLAFKPSGCVIWMFFDQDTLAFDHFLWFGKGPGEALGSLDDFSVGMHTRGNAQGVKGQRPNIRVLTKASFTRLDSVADVVLRLFGESPASPSQ